MADDGELEKRAIEELLRETSRARVRAETMGPAGWMKCPLRGTNKRFLLNTLRSSGLQRRRSDGPSDAGRSAPGERRQRGDRRSHDDGSRSRTPPRHSTDGGSRHRDRKRHRGDGGGDHGDERHDGEKDKSNGHKDKLHREQQRHGKDGHSTDPETHTLHSRESSPGEGHRSSRSHSPSRERCHSHHSGDSSSTNSSQASGHAPPALPASP